MSEDGKIKIAVNNNPVYLTGKEQTGFSIKKSAVEQGDAIKIDFVLSVVDGPGTNKGQTIGNEDSIEVHDGQEFRAVRPDDNS